MPYIEHNHPDYNHKSHLMPYHSREHCDECDRHHVAHHHCHEFCHDHPIPIQEQILEIIAKEQDYLSRILAALAVKVEKTANWLPDTIPDEPFNQVVDKVKALECVIGQEIDAVAKKELAIEAIIKQICQCPEPPGPHPKPLNCICPCHLFQSCKVVGHCLIKGTA